MAIEDRDDFVDVVAQAVIDRIEERHRVSSLVEQVVARVIEIQKKEAALKAEAEAAQSEKVEGTNG
jgi:ethanolamine utilization protein EutQ (cupin superfamily)